MPGTDTKMLVLNSTFEEINRLESFVEALQEWTNFSEDDYNRILLTLNEAVNNAIIHGNKQDPDKQVVINTKYDEKKSILIISVEDEGDGFDPNAIPDPLKEENLLKEGGRGVYLIGQYADDIKFSKQGTQLTITYYLDTK